MSSYDKIMEKNRSKNYFNPRTQKNEEPQGITVNDVIYKPCSNKKESYVSDFSKYLEKNKKQNRIPNNIDKKPNPNNRKLLLEYLKQEANIINNQSIV
jgi:hypothetical protein